MRLRINGFRILTFDVYGTLIDWESGMINALRPLTGKVGRSLSTDEILEAHAYHESHAQKWTPTRVYRDLLAVVYRRLGEEWGIGTTWEECRAYGKAVGDWPAFHDSPGALAYLKEHFRLAVLTNTDNASFEFSKARLGVEFDFVFTAEDIGSYKPDGRNFDYMLSALARAGYGRSDILHVAESQFHDHVPARSLGLANCWIYRRHEKPGFGATMPPAEEPGFDFRFNSMAELAEAHRKEASVSN
ncbi:MAG: haloacid dehalogenase type II [Rhodobacteraceae bacterium]|nr:haloacid dehalogenase type II [Paracoccaceae bacterium]MCY4136642.1 haloacid dehalogenase type II [Paracoccaceae bacterium]